MAGGRPTKYTKELGNLICERLSHGESLRNICLDEGMPDASSVHRWVLEGEHEEFYKQYARAREIQAENMFDEILDIADDGSNDFMTVKRGKEEIEVEDREVTNRSKLRVESRKWYLSKVLPKKFGDKLDLTSGGEKLPTPILNAIPSDSSSKEDTKS